MGLDAKSEPSSSCSSIGFAPGFVLGSLARRQPTPTHDPHSCNNNVKTYLPYSLFSSLPSFPSPAEPLAGLLALFLVKRQPTPTPPTTILNIAVTTTSTPAHTNSTAHCNSQLQLCYVEISDHKPALWTALKKISYTCHGTKTRPVLSSPVQKNQPLVYKRNQDAKYVVSDDILPDRFKIKKGDLMRYVPYLKGRMTHLWGSDAKELRPEIWLQNGVFKSQSPFKFTAFQAGPRICLGKDFAYMQMKIFVAVLVQI